jgi:16S rRNA (adenine1518-N6/adenine1519-N6)-dimethyltransferase
MSRLLSTEVKRLLERFGLRARKSLGQHFLIDKRVLQRIVSTAELTPEDTVIEVGPGLGILTKELAKRARRVIAVEADPSLASALREVVADISIISADILRTDPALLLASAGVEDASPSYKVVANIPYYITAPILRHFFEASLKPSLMVVMVQKEVGEAIVAQPGRMSLLAISVQFYGKPAIVDHVPARSFFPPPKVDSVILRIKLYEQPPVSVPQTDKFFDVVRAGFSAPRKQLRNALAQGWGIPPQEATSLLERAMINPQRRAETLHLEEWARICEAISNHGA